MRGFLSHVNGVADGGFMELNQDALNELLRYDRETGKLFWKNRGRHWFSSDRHYKSWHSTWAGKEALTADMNGYRQGRILYKRVLAHRVIWMMVNGFWPDEIDHINGCKSDNRLVNLREVTHLGNSKNQSRPKNNKSGIIGVNWHKVKRKWQALINLDGRTVHLGYYDNIEDAAKVRGEWEVKVGFHKNHGR